MSHDLRPIRNDADHAAALAEVERLWGAADGTDDGDRLDVLATLIDCYEAAQFPIDAPDPIEAIRFRMEQQGLAAADVEPLLGGPSMMAEIMSGTRGLSLDMIRRVHATLGISADVLIRRSRDEAA